MKDSESLISATVRKLLGGLGEMRLYTQQETNQLAGEAKRLQEAVNPTVENLRLQSQIIRDKADITIASLQNVAEKAKATTDVVVAAADTIEVLAEESQRHSAAIQRITSVAASVTPSYAALLSGHDPELAGQNQDNSNLLQLPYRR